MTERYTVTHKKKMLECLKETLGIVSSAADKAEISRKTHYEWLKDDEWYREEVDAIQARQGDFVESKLIKQIHSDDTTAIIFYCKTRLKNRGYEETVRNNNYNAHKLLEGSKEQCDAALNALFINYDKDK